MNAFIDPSEVDIPKEVCDPDSIPVVSRVKGQISKDQQPEEFHDNQTPSASNIPSTQRSVPSTQHSLAIEVVRQKKIYHVPEAGSFVVEGSNGDKYSVQLYPKESCSCPSLATCYHILAVQMSIGVEELSEKRIYNLTQLRKNTRKRPNKRAGRKQPRPCDRDISIIPAPDSTLQTSLMCSMPKTDKSLQSPAPRTPITPRSILKRKPSHPTTVPTTPVSKKKIKFESPDNSTAVETKCLTPESPFPQPFSTPVAGTSKEPTVTQISPSKSQPSSSVQPTTKRNWVNLSDRVMLSFKEKNDIQNDKKLCCNIIDFAQQLLKQQFPSVNGLQFTGYAPILENSGKWTYLLQMTREIRLPCRSTIPDTTTGFFQSKTPVELFSH